MTPTSKRFRLDRALGAPLARPNHHAYGDPIAAMSLPTHAPLTPNSSLTLAQAVAKSRHPRNHATAQLEPHRDELLRLAGEGNSAETLAIGLGLIGIKVGRETMRRWLVREMGTKSKRKVRRKRTAGAPAECVPISQIGGMMPP
jgi:hypothetical protein